MSSLSITSKSISDIDRICSLRTNRQIAEQVEKYALAIMSGDVDSIVIQLRMMELIYVNIVNNRIYDILSVSDTHWIQLYYPWAIALNHKIRNCHDYQVYLDGELFNMMGLIDYEKGNCGDLYDLCYSIAHGQIVLDIKIADFANCQEFFDSHYLLYYMLYDSGLYYLAVWYYVTWIITPNYWFTLTLVNQFNHMRLSGNFQTEKDVKRAHVILRLSLDKHLKLKNARHWELVRRSGSIDRKDKMFRISYSVINSTFKFEATINFIRDRYQQWLIGVLSLMFGQRLALLFDKVSQAFKVEQSQRVTNIIAHILHYVCCDVSICTTLADLMNQRSWIYKELQDHDVDFNEPVVIQFGCIGPYIHGPCCVVGRSFQYNWTMNNGVLCGEALFKNPKVKYRGEYQNGYLSYASMTDTHGNNRVSASYIERGSVILHGFCNVDDVVMKYDYNNLIV